MEELINVVANVVLGLGITAVIAAAAWVCNDE